MDSGRVFFDGSCHGNFLLLGNRDTLFRGAGPRSLLSLEETSKRRPFFSSSEDLIDDEFYDEQLPEKKRRLTPDQVQLLEKSFEAENKLEPERKAQLAKKLGLQPRQVAVWFQNRRARWKTKQLERDYDLLKASYDSLLSDFQTVSKENEKLKSEVVSLTEKLQANKAVTAAASAVGQESGKLVPGDADNAVQVNVKAEDRLSSGSGGSDGSAVVDEIGLQLMDSGDSYFAQDYGHCMDPIDGVQSEEDDGSDDGRSYFSDVFAAAAAAADHHQQEEAVQLGWWDWS